MLKLYVDCVFRSNIKCAEEAPRGYILPEYRDICNIVWPQNSLQHWNVFPGIEYEISGNIIILMPLKDNRRKFMAKTKEETA